MAASRGPRDEMVRLAAGKVKGKRSYGCVVTDLDTEFLAEAQKAKLAVNPLSGEETEKIVAGLFQASPEMLRKLKDILYPK